MKKADRKEAARMVRPHSAQAIEELQEAKGSLSGRAIVRANAMIMLLSGRSIQSTAESLGVSTSSVRAWQERWVERGVPGIRRKPRARKGLDPWEDADWRLNDTDLGKAMDCTRQAAAKQRAKRGAPSPEILPPKPEPAPKRPRTAEDIYAVLGWRVGQARAESGIRRRELAALMRGFTGASWKTSDIVAAEESIRGAGRAMSIETLAAFSDALDRPPWLLVSFRRVRFGRDPVLESCDGDLRRCLGETIAELRSWQGWSPGELADELIARGHGKWTATLVRDVETGVFQQGHRNLNVHHLPMFADALCVRLADLVRRPGE